MTAVCQCSGMSPRAKPETSKSLKSLISEGKHHSNGSGLHRLSPLYALDARGGVLCDALESVQLSQSLGMAQSPFRHPSRALNPNRVQVGQHQHNSMTNL